MKDIRAQVGIFTRKFEQHWGFDKGSYAVSKAMQNRAMMRLLLHTFWNVRKLLHQKKPLCFCPGSLFSHKFTHALSCIRICVHKPSSYIYTSPSKSMSDTDTHGVLCLAVDCVRSVVGSWPRSNTTGAQAGVLGQQKWRWLSRVCHTCTLDDICLSVISFAFL